MLTSPSANIKLLNVAKQNSRTIEQGQGTLWARISKRLRSWLLLTIPWFGVRSLFMKANSRLLYEVILSTKRLGLQLKTQIPSYQWHSTLYPSNHSDKEEQHHHRSASQLDLCSPWHSPLGNSDVTGLSYSTMTPKESSPRIIAVPR